MGTNHTMSQLEEALSGLKRQVAELSRSQLDMDREMKELQEERDNLGEAESSLHDLEDWKDNARAIIKPLLEDMERHADDLWARTRDERVPVEERREDEKLSLLLQDWCVRLGDVEDAP